APTTFMAFANHPLRGVRSVAGGVVRRRIFELVGVLAVVGIMAAGSPASAITWGTIDTTHPDVGAILIVRSDGSVGEFCSGTLVSARVFLTAGHCTDALTAFGIPASRLRISFAPNLFAEGAVRLAVSGYQTHPEYHCGPTFFIDPSSHAEYIVAVTSWGDSVCKSTNNNYRVDLESSRSFIDDMIASNP